MIARDFDTCAQMMELQQNLCNAATLKNIENWFGLVDQLILLNAGQKYCRMLQGEHSAVLLTFIKLPFVIKIFLLSIFEWPLYTDLTVNCKMKID